jgi:sugar phosphate isomerase/epimerase
MLEGRRPTVGQGIRIGNQSAFSAAPFTLPFDHAVGHGYDAFEWFPDKQPSGAGWDLADIDAELRASIRTRARDFGVSLSVHAPLCADPLRPGSGTVLEESLRFARDVGATLLNVHLTDPSRVEEYASAIAPLMARCVASGVRLAIENIPAAGPEAFNRLFALLPRPNGMRPMIGMCLDVGHANLHGQTHNDYLAYVDRLGPIVPIIHLHLHENHGDRDSHLVIFTGPAGQDPSGVIGLLRRLRQRGFAGSIILEQWPDPPALLDAARARLLEILEE